MIMKMKKMMTMIMMILMTMRIRWKGRGVVVKAMDGPCLSPAYNNAPPRS